MGTYTPRLNLLKPAEDDFYNVTTQQSENWQKIDDEWLKLDEELKVDDYYIAFNLNQIKRNFKSLSATHIINNESPELLLELLLFEKQPLIIPKVTLTARHDIAESKTMLTQILTFEDFSKTMTKKMKVLHAFQEPSPELKFENQ